MVWGEAESTTNPKWPDLGSNSCHYGGKLATNYLSYSTTYLPDVMTSANVTEIHGSYINIWAELRWNDMKNTELSWSI
jgi:hypothetical protein